MRLVLSVVSEQAAALGAGASRIFDEEGGLLGRSASCDWVLPDATNTVSARHATIASNGRGFVITDTSTNGVYINTVDAPLGRGNSSILADGDTLYIGDYLISVKIVAEARAPSLLEVRREPPARQPPPPETSADPFAMNAPGTMVQRDPLAGFGAAPIGRPGRSASAPPIPGGRVSREAERPARVDPLAILSAPEAAPPSAAPPLMAAPPVARAAAPPPPPAPAAPSLPTGIPDDFFAGLAGAPPASPPPPPPVVARPVPPPSPPAPTIAAPPAPPARSAAVIPADFDLGFPQAGPPGPPPATAAPVAAPPLAPVPPPPRPVEPRRALGASLAADFVALRPVGEDTAVDPAASAVLDPVAVLRQRAAGRASGPLDDGLTRAVPPAPQRPAAALPMPAMPDAAEGPGDDTLWQGLGIDPSTLSAEDRALLLGEIGRAMRVAVDGLVAVLGARRMVKDEFRLEQTQLQAGGNNPLKFAGSGEEALRQFLVKRHPGFLALADAIEEGFRDVKAHELASIAATEASLGTILTRLSPPAIEGDGGNAGLLGRRPDKGKLWDRFCEAHATMIGDLNRTTREVFGEEFARAYQRQLNRLRKERPS